LIFGELEAGDYFIFKHRHVWKKVEPSKRQEKCCEVEYNAMGISVPMYANLADNRKVEKIDEPE
jgi:hypothetical protein